MRNVSFGDTNGLMPIKTFPKADIPWRFKYRNFSCKNLMMSAKEARCEIYLCKALKTEMKNLQKQNVRMLHLVI